MNLDPTDSKKAVNYKKIDIGFGFAAEIMGFLKAVHAFLEVLATKLLEKAPLKYELVRPLACLDPREIARGCSESNVSRMKSILNVLDNAKRVPGGARACEEILRQW